MTTARLLPSLAAPDAAAPETNSDWIGTFDAWLTCPANKNLVLDGGVYLGVTNAADDWHPWAGMTRRF